MRLKFQSTASSAEMALCKLSLREGCIASSVDTTNHSRAMHPSGSRTITASVACTRGVSPDPCRCRFRTELGEQHDVIRDGRALQPGALVTVRCTWWDGEDLKIDEDPKEDNASAGAALAENLPERPHPGPTAQPLRPPPHLPTQVTSERHRLCKRRT